MTEKKKARIVSEEEIRRRLDFMPEVVKKKEEATEEINKIKEKFRTGLKDIFKKKS